jgi:hypothetical protein
MFFIVLIVNKVIRLIFGSCSVLMTFIPMFVCLFIGTNKLRQRDDLLMLCNKYLLCFSGVSIDQKTRW